jgi:hypothetical protein
VVDVDDHAAVHELVEEAQTQIAVPAVRGLAKAAGVAARVVRGEDATRVRRQRIGHLAAEAEQSEDRREHGSSQNP